MPDELPGDEHETERQDTGPLHELTLGRSRPTPESPGSRISRASTEENSGLDALASRCHAKAGAARWAAERQRRVRERAEHPDEDAPTDPALGNWADMLTDAFYWTSIENPSGWPDIALLDHVGGCFEAVSEALRLVQGHRNRGAGLEKSLPLLAEAQSALRQSLHRLRAAEDPDQRAAYEWVREAAARQRIYLKRHMRADDQADPDRWADLMARIETDAGSTRRSRIQKSRLDRLHSILGPLREGQGAETNCRAVVEEVDAMVAEGIPPSDPELRDLLMPVIDELPARNDLPPGFRLVLREIDRYLATRTPRSSGVTAPEPTSEVRGAARLLSGRSVVLIGGVRRPEAQAMLRAALGLVDLIWIETREHQSIRNFEATVARPDVAVVLLAIRWSSHAFGDVKQFCDRYGKPLVRLPGGYNPNQVAVQILAQCGERLGDGSI